MVSKTERTRFAPRLISLAVASCFASGAALANPVGPTVVNGLVTMNQSGKLLSITNSPNSIINWQSFSIGAGEITRFTQQSAASAVLNRVVGAGGAIDPSVILGALQSNGRVFLLNPSGIVFGAGAQVDVAGLVASTLNLSNADFLGGRLRFTDVPGAGAVVNQGTLNAASGGQVYLVGSSVTNNGIITSPKGEVILAAGKSVELVNPGTPNLRVEIKAPDNEARNLGSIVADAGRVGIYAGLINHSGTTRVDSAVATADGRIVLKATKNATVEAGSTLSANGPSGGQVTVQSGDTTTVSGSIAATGSAGKGGTVKVLGNLVGLDGEASIDVSGAAGGGTALVGGDFQGKNPDVQNASKTYFGPNATIRADALGNGDGGTVVVWSDDATGAYGTISARGGSNAGNGGFVEVSSRGWLDFHTKVDTRAPKGRTGTLLLDPADVCLFTEDTTNCPGSGEGAGMFSGGVSTVFFSSTPVNTDASWIEVGASGGLSSLLGSNNVTITTSNGSPTGTGSITIADDLDFNTPHMLQLVAHNDVNVKGEIRNSQPGELRIYAGWNEGAASTTAIKNAPFAPIPVVPNKGNINVEADIDMEGNTLLRAGNNITVASNVEVSVSDFSTGSRKLTVQADNAVTLNTSARLVVDVSGGEGVRNAFLEIKSGAGGITANQAQIFTQASANGASGTGPGGEAKTILGTTGNINVQNFSFVGAEGGRGALARVILAADGSISIGSGSLVRARETDNGDPTANGMAAQVALIGNGITLGDLVDVVALGGEGTSISGDGSVNMVSAPGMAHVTAADSSGFNALTSGISPVGAITVSGAEGIVAAGGAGGLRGGNGWLAGLATSFNVSGSLIGASGGGASLAGGDARLTLRSTGNSISISEGSVIHSIGGSASSSGGAKGGVARLALESAAGPISVNQSAVVAEGGSAANGGDGVVGIGGVGLLSFLDGLIGGAEPDLATAQGAIASGPISLTSASVFSEGGHGSESAGGHGGFVAATTGSFSMLNSHVDVLGGTGVAAGGDATSLIIGSNIRIESTGSSSSSSTTLFVGGGSGSSSGVPGAGTALFGVLGTTGQLQIVNELVDVSGGKQGSAFGPGNIILIFPNRVDGGFSVDGVDGALSGGTGNPPSHGFRVNGQIALLDTNFFTFYFGIQEPPPAFDAQLISSLLTAVDRLTPDSGKKDETAEEKEKKKKEAECS